MKITIFGTGCPRCKALEAMIREIVAEMEIDAQVEKVTSIEKMLTQGVISLPSVAIDGTLKCTGRVPSRSEVSGWLAK